MLQFWARYDLFHAVAQLQLPGQVKSVMFSMSNCSFTTVQDNKHKETDVQKTGRETETALYEPPSGIFPSVS